MHPREPNLVNPIETYRPPCPGCGANMWLARIEPASKEGHDLRTFECAMCGESETMSVRYR